MEIIKSFTRITKDMGEFSAAHQLPTYNGPCRNLHGHNYRVTVTVEGPVNSEPQSVFWGMVIDFTVLKTIYREKVHDLVDHSLMLGTKPLDWMSDAPKILEAGKHEVLSAAFGKVYILPVPVTTAENIARWVHSQITQGLRERGYSDVIVAEVIVQETDSGRAGYAVDTSGKHIPGG